MSVTTNCLDSIIGLSRTTCDCFTEDAPFDVSKSGLYLDELEGLSLNVAGSIANCENGSLWDILEGARRSAILSFKSDLMASLLTVYKKKRHSFSGIIGSEKFKATLNIGTTYAGARQMTANIIGGIQTIRRIGLVFSTSNTFVIDVYDGIHDDAIASYTVSAIANKLSWFTIPEPLVLPMSYEAASEAPNYYFIYRVADSGQPKDNKAGCGCGSGYKYFWNSSNPVFKHYPKYEWSEYIMLSGVTGNDIADRANWATTANLNGIILDAKFECKIGELICTEELDFETNETAIAMAYAIRYRAGQFLIDKILASNSINIFTMTGGDRLMQKKGTYTTEYQNYIAWLTDNINTQANDCLVCNDFDDIVKVGILS